MSSTPLGPLPKSGEKKEQWKRRRNEGEMENKKHRVTIIEMVDISGPRFTVGVVFHSFEKKFHGSNGIC